MTVATLRKIHDTFATPNHPHDQPEQNSADPDQILHSAASDQVYTVCH